MSEKRLAAFSPPASWPTCTQLRRPTTTPRSAWSDRKSTRPNSRHLGNPGAPPDLPSFPPRRPSDLSEKRLGAFSPPASWPTCTQLRRPSTTPRSACSVELLSSRSEEHTSELQSLRHLVCR